MRDALTARLITLAKAHDLLTNEKLEGAELQAISGQALSGYKTGRAIGPRIKPNYQLVKLREHAA